MMPPFPPAVDLVLLFITELLFGFSYNQAVAWFGTRHERLFKFLVSWSVVFGVAGTIVLQLVFFWDFTFAAWQGFLVTFLGFCGSGLPMIIGSMNRAGRKTHKAKRLPNNVKVIVEDVMAEMLAFAKDVNEKAGAGEVKAATLIDLVHRLHTWVGTLKSL